MQRGFNADTKFGKKSFSHNRFGNSQAGSFRFAPSSRSRSFGGGRSRNANKSVIDISKFIKKADFSPVKEVVSENTFADFGLCAELNANLAKKGFVTPTPIQDRSISHVMEGRDLIGLAQTGTGKTAAFLLPLLDKIWKDHSQKVLIIAPTRELALQIDTEFRNFSWGMRIFSATCVGGMPIFKQIQNLKRNPSVVIGTPGRLKDLNDRGIIHFENFNNVVIDEIDRMLDMGFIDDIKIILSKSPADRQSLVFSATMPIRIREIVKQFLKEPITIEISSGVSTQNVDQDVIRVRDHAMKFEQLRDLLKQDECKKVLIFSETKIEVEKLASNLSNEGFNAESIHGDKRQRERARALQMFKQNAIKILVATDVAARGLDIDDISHVINYTVPQTYEDYIHRIGRTGRGNKKGAAFTFVSAR